MLYEETLFEKIDKVEKSIARIREFEQMAVKLNSRGFQVCISGGKDSSVIQELVIRSGVRAFFVHNLTTVDHEKTIRFIQGERERMIQKGYQFEIMIPRYTDGQQITMWNGIEKHGLPTRDIRWCCDRLKEWSGHGTFCVMGIRWAESEKRKIRGIYEVGGKRKSSRVYLMNDNDNLRKITEACSTRRKFFCNPIIDWSDNDVWEFISKNKLPVNPLYALGYRRVGCIGCPQNPKQRKRDFESMPKYKDMYYRAGKKYIERIKEEGTLQVGFFDSADTYFDWWLSDVNGQYYDEDNLLF
jgi:phosphoadenosine phosphosulfate reductase